MNFRASVGVTGSNGFIGMHLLQKLKENRLITEGFDESLNSKQSLLNEQSLKEFAEGKQVIFHLAGKNRASELEIMHANALGTLNLLEALRKNKEENTKVVFASSMQVYNLTSRKVLHKENEILMPQSIYGLSKKFGEELIARYSEDYGIQAVILRLANVFGPKCRPFYNSVIATFAYLASQGKPLAVNGKGLQGRDFIFVDDVVETMLKAAKLKRKKFEIFNVCTGKAVNIREVANAVKKISNKNVEITFKPAKEETNFLVGNPAKAKKILDFKARTKFEEGLKQTIKSFQR